MGGCLASPQREATANEEDGDSTIPASKSPSCCVAFQLQRNNGKRLYYLRYEARGGAAAAAGNCGRSLRVNGGEGVASPYTRFYIVPSREHHGLVHIRCCYDNKYWVAQQRQHHSGWAIVGGADEPEEDQSKPTCTLFKTTRLPPSSIRLLHVHLGKYACLPASTDDSMSKLEDVSLSLLAGDEKDIITSFTVHDLSEQSILPRHLAFKGDNGMYLRWINQGGCGYLQFSGRDVADKAVVNAVQTNDDGTFRVRSSLVGKFWRRSPNWIWADSTADAADGDDNTLFRAVKLSDAGVFALQNLGNDYFCKRLTTEGKRSCLNAATPTITPDAKLQLEEPVVSREIYNVAFDLSRPRIYGRSVVTMATASVLNDSTTSDNMTKVTLAYTDTEKRSWGSSVTLKLDVAATTLCAGAPVIVAEGSVKLSSEFSGSYNWGSAVEKETAEEVAHQVTVPPKTRVTVTLTATRASCDVPFSYTQRDTLIDGQEDTYDMDDGLYTIVNYYDFKYVASEEDI
ncbi:hypothetical protein ACP70R_007659 [Stipagrostis hirtigluma subsp. patula]